jgi:hypothetical protein
LARSPSNGAAATAPVQAEVFVPRPLVATVTVALTTIAEIALTATFGGTPVVAVVGTLIANLLNFSCRSGRTQQCGTSQKQISKFMLHEFHLLRPAAVDTLCSSANSLLRVIKLQFECGDRFSTATVTDTVGSREVRAIS